MDAKRLFVPGTAVTWEEWARVLEANEMELRRELLAARVARDGRDAAVKGLNYVYELEPDLKKEGMENFEGYFCHWNKIINWAASQGVSGYAQDPMELLATLVNQRDEAREQLAKVLKPWTQTPPTEPGMYWMWQGDPDGAPFPVTVMWSGMSGKCFLAAGQWGWTHAQDVDGEDLEGTWWMPVVEPLAPETAN